MALPQPLGARHNSALPCPFLFLVSKRFPFDICFRSHFWFIVHTVPFFLVHFLVFVILIWVSDYVVELSFLQKCFPKMVSYSFRSVMFLHFCFNKTSEQQGPTKTQSHKFTRKTKRTARHKKTQSRQTNRKTQRTAGPQQVQSQKLNCKTKSKCHRSKMKKLFFRLALNSYN